MKVSSPWQALWVQGTVGAVSLPTSKWASQCATCVAKGSRTRPSPGAGLGFCSFGFVIRQARGWLSRCQPPSAGRLSCTGCHSSFQGAEVCREVRGLREFPCVSSYDSRTLSKCTYC